MTNPHRTEKHRRPAMLAGMKKPNLATALAWIREIARIAIYVHRAMVEWKT